MTATTTYLCIGCPLGCRLEVDEDPASHAIVEVRGFSCRRGKEYAMQEHTAPQRIVTTTVGVSGGLWPRLPVRTSKPVPKGQVLAICRQLSTVSVRAPVRLGQVIVGNVANTGCDVVATRDMGIEPDRNGPILADRAVSV
jgi:CxxC motif-containing protein